MGGGPVETARANYAAMEPSTVHHLIGEQALALPGSTDGLLGSRGSILVHCGGTGTAWEEAAKHPYGEEKMIRLFETGWERRER